MKAYNEDLENVNWNRLIELIVAKLDSDAVQEINRLTSESIREKYLLESIEFALQVKRQVSKRKVDSMEDDADSASTETLSILEALETHEAEEDVFSFVNGTNISDDVNDYSVTAEIIYDNPSLWRSDGPSFVDDSLPQQVSSVSSVQVQKFILVSIAVRAADDCN
ncbi:hypothetical protein HPULCUR_007867 [Helicostylum pulchrum]|uniref:Uncharacterized protein n=1 Tax=Helicostylum pulchrum TaxID=562976 RepID=A0ABP9Y7X2_9FUNG